MTTTRTSAPVPVRAAPARAVSARTPLVRVAVVALAVLSVYLVGRAIAEPFVIDLANPDTYRHDWGGPHLIGVLAVHCLPGVVGLLWLADTVRGRRSRRGDRRSRRADR